ncbi:P-loop containing nucleoside triphosphate hydrolase protein [Corynascus similis CBS 632.67]
MVTFASDSLTKLCSEDQLLLLDSIDRLRLQGINHYISLPQIIVCGDQSSGKSSVLEAISGVSFPVKSNLCTRFPTELVLRKAAHESVSVSIVPHELRTEAERKALLAFGEELRDFDDLPDLVERAKIEMGITVHGRAFAKDILRIEVTGPNHPHLTIVDLPGLIHSETKSQTASDVQLIQDVVQSYMREPRCIILAVVSAKNDFANQVVLKLARTADPRGTRTLGVITKPDTLVPGGQSEAMYVSLARNQEVEFRHGWHVLKNMDSEKGATSLKTRDEEEAEFFRSGAWTALPYSCLGIDKLRSRLSKVLLQQITAELASLMDEIDQKFKACKDQLEKLGHPRATPEEQRRYLIDLSQSLQALVTSSTGGNYDGSFFTDARTKSGYEQRIRAVIQNLNEDFASEMSLRGHYRQITDPESENEPHSSGDCGVVRISRNDFVDEIDELMRKTRGRELPGTFNPMIVVDLFREQCRPWEAIARRHVEKVWGAASRFVKIVVEHAADPSTAKALWRLVIDPAMGKILEEMRAKTTELLSPHRSGHPITYNHYFTEALQKVRGSRQHKTSPAQILRTFFSVSNLEPEQHLSGYYNLSALAESLEECRELNMRRFAANEALDCLNAYYKVAMKRFIDDVAVEVIEAKLMTALNNILSPMSVYEMSTIDVTLIAGESEETRAERDQLNKQLEVLRNGLATCKRFVELRISGGREYPRPG